MASRTYSQLASLYLTYAVIPVTLTYTQLATSPALAGTVAGSSNATSSLTGNGQRLGTISATSTAFGLATGLPALASSHITWASTSTGSVIGREDDLGIIAGINQSVDSIASGSPALAGIAAGTSASTGIVISRQPQPHAGGGGRPRAAYTPQPTMHLPRFGWTYGLSLEDGKIIGQRGQAGQTFGMQSTAGAVAGQIAISKATVRSFATVSASSILGHVTIREDGEQELLAALGYL